jgi:hypothetical protein
LASRNAQFALRYRIRPSHSLTHATPCIAQISERPWDMKLLGGGELLQFIFASPQRMLQCDSQTICVCVSVYTYYIPSIYSHAIAIIYIYLYIPIYRWFLPMTWPFATIQSRLQVCHVRMHGP